MLKHLPQWLQPWFSTRGRAGRGHFWLTQLLFVLAGPAIALAVLPVALLLHGIGLPRLVVLIAITPIVVPAFHLACRGVIATVIRRLHDRGKSAQWIWVFFGPAVLALLTGLGNGRSMLDLAVSVASIATSLWYVIELGCLPGTTGDNAYGPHPAVGSGPAHEAAPASPQVLALAAPVLRRERQATIVKPAAARRAVPAAAAPTAALTAAQPVPDAPYAARLARVKTRA